MGFLKKMVLIWKAAPVESKVEAVLSLVCDIGTGLAANDISKRIGKDHSLPGRLLIGAGLTGLGIAAGNVASKALNESYGPVIVHTINKFKTANEEFKAKNQNNQPEEEVKEEKSNEEAPGKE